MQGLDLGEVDGSSPAAAPVQQVEAQLCEDYHVLLDHGQSLKSDLGEALLQRKPCGGSWGWEVLLSQQIHQHPHCHHAGWRRLVQHGHLDPH